MAKKKQSRGAAWLEAVLAARDAQSHLESALSDLIDLQSEYQDWRDNLPDNLDGSPVAEKLDAVIDLDITSVQDDLSSLLDELEAADLPLGFGRD